MHWQSPMAVVLALFVTCASASKLWGLPPQWIMVEPSGSLEQAAGTIGVPSGDPLKFVKLVGRSQSDYGLSQLQIAKMVGKRGQPWFSQGEYGRLSPLAISKMVGKRGQPWFSQGKYGLSKIQIARAKMVGKRDLARQYKLMANKMFKMGKLKRRGFLPYKLMAKMFKMSKLKRRQFLPREMAGMFGGRPEKRLQFLPYELIRLDQNQLEKRRSFATHPVFKMMGDNQEKRGWSPYGTPKRFEVAQEERRASSPYEYFTMVGRSQEKRAFMPFGMDLALESYPKRGAEFQPMYEIVDVEDAVECYPGMMYLGMNSQLCF